MYDAQDLARKCNVSVDTVYHVRKLLNLDRLPTVEEIMQRNKKCGRKFSMCPNIKTSNLTNN